MFTLQVAFVALASGLMLCWILLALTGPRKSPTPPPLAILRYGSPLRVFALVMALLPPALAIYVVWNFPWRSTNLLMAAGTAFLATSLISGLLLIEVERTQITRTEDALARQSPWTGQCVLPWSDIENVTYSPINRWLVVTGGGRVIRISRHLVGLGEFVALVRRKLAAERYARAAAVFHVYPETRP